MAALTAKDRAELADLAIQCGGRTQELIEKLIVDFGLVERQYRDVLEQKNALFGTVFDLRQTILASYKKNFPDHPGQ